MQLSARLSNMSCMKTWFQYTYIAWGHSSPEGQVKHHQGAGAAEAGAALEDFPLKHDDPGPINHKPNSPGAVKPLRVSWGGDEVKIIVRESPDVFLATGNVAIFSKTIETYLKCME